MYPTVPNHDMIYLEILVGVIDDWEHSDVGPRLELDGTPFSLWSSLSDSSNAVSNVCGTSVNDLGGITVVAKINHSGTSLTFRVLNIMDSDTDTESWAFRGVQITFLNNTAGHSETVCGSVLYNAFTMNENECPCAAGEYDDSGCQACDSAC